MSDSTDYCDPPNIDAPIKNEDEAKDVSTMDQNGGQGNLQNLQLNTNKAGMEGLDIGKINDIIQKASAGSKFFYHKQKCQDRINSKIFQMKLTISNFSELQIKKAEEEMTRIGSEMELSRDFSRTIVHVDMDMFYAAVEMRDEPSLRNRPMAVGSSAMLSTSNYAARKFGVRAAMPGFIAKKLCPDLAIVPCDFAKYREVSSQVQRVFEAYDPHFCPMSLDEAYLDITEYVHANGHEYCQTNHGEPILTIAESVVQELRRKIEEKTQLTASAGIACNTRLAKVCSDMNKPNGQYFLPPDKKIIMDFVTNLPIRKVSGIGNVTEQQLRSLGVITCSDLWTHRGLLRLLFSESSYFSFLRIALGLGSTEVSPGTERDRKSISTETTFAGTSDRSTLANLCVKLCKDLKEDMSRKKLYGKVFTLKMKTTNFQVRTRAQTLVEYTQDEQVMTSVAHKLLFNELDSSEHSSSEPLSLRLLGVRMSTLMDKEQLSSKRQLTLTHLFKSKHNENHADTQIHSQFMKKEEGKLHIENVLKTNTEILNGDCATLESKLNTLSASSEANHDTSWKEVAADRLNPCDPIQEASTSNTREGNASYTCPVCSRRKFKDVKALNSHLDTCLNLEEVKKLVQESNSSVGKASTNSDTNVCVVTNASNKKDLKGKRKTSATQSNLCKKQKNNSRAGNTLYKYFNLE